MQFPFGISSDQEMDPLYEWLLVGHNADGSVKGVGSNQLATFSRAAALSVVTGAGRFLFHGAATVIGVIAAVNEAATGSSLIFDLNKNGSTMFTTQANRPTISAGAFKTSSTAVPAVTSVAAGDYLSVDIDQVGSTVPGSDLVVQVVYRLT